MTGFEGDGSALGYGLPTAPGQAGRMRLTRYRFGEFELDPGSRELWRGGERIALPLKSLECLAYLVANRERAVGRDELISAVWGRTEVSDTVIAQTMRRARKALDDAGDRQAMVRTVSGFGYRWVAPVEVVDALPADVVTPVTLVPPAQDPLQLAAAQAAAATQQLSTPPPALKWKWVGVVLVVAVAVAAAAWWNLRDQPDVATKGVVDSDLVMVLPVSVEPADPEFTWVRLGAMDYAAGRLRAGALKVAPSEQTLHLSSSLMARPDQTGQLGPGDTTLKRLLEQSGARWLLVPQALQERGRWRVRLLAVSRQSDVQVEAQGDTPLRAMAVATDAWLRRIGRSPSLAAPSAITERLQRIDAELDAGQLQAAREQITRAPATQRSDARMQVREGQLEYRAGNIERAKVLFDGALAAAGQSTATRAKGLMGLGAVALRQKRFADAQQRYTDALAALQAAGNDIDDPTLVGNAYNGRGVARIQANDVDGAIADLGLARIAMQQNGDLISAAMVGSNIGQIEVIRGHLPQAVQEFDRSNEVFRRYQVRDYLGATLAAKSGAQLRMVQPAQALQTTQEAAALAKAIEDPTLINRIGRAHASALLSNGQIDAAEAVLRKMQAANAEDADGVLAGLAMEIALSRGDRDRAARIASHVRSPSSSTDLETVLVAAQAAGSAADAEAWSSLIDSGIFETQRNQTWGAPLARGIIDRRFGSRGSALAAATSATDLANREGAPNDRVRVGILRGLLLLEEGQPQAASAVLGELDAYASVDYRVAWFAWHLYRHGKNTAVAERARLQAEALRGQRSLDAEPLL
ncbi:winged helix-turn-helix domain-containing protein [Lysobacter arenosi]|uniref:Winged helix-turn-helix domain-containing protein n=1 Tax=Lysobacter arenosi TaxID=2795387 RepID=A0ABX7RAV6_9GAMM|nr:winged helix-turn-helix domain-containing protein [Lysobacter arenosi]QSX74494.1 winged helix-turn-helix domain-containing protein [Lysobacter arenosi]